MYTFELNDIKIEIDGKEGLFSPNSPDKGTVEMLKIAEIKKGDRVLDLGCGTGIVGIYAAKITEPEKVFMSDISDEAVEISRINAEKNIVSGVNIIKSDGFSEITEKDFNVILSNPPYHEDFGVPKRFIEKGFNRLTIGGKFYMVTKRELWYKNKFISIFGGVKIFRVSGYFVFLAEKKSENYSNKKPNKKKSKNRPVY